MEDDIRSWLKVILDEKIENFSLQILGNSEKGDGYVGDVVFISLTSTNGKPSKEYNLVLKCSKRSEILRKTSPVKEAFINEMYVYDTVFPAFTRFQLEKGITEPFDSIPKCYGTLTLENMEIIALENLKNSGYTLWGKKRQWTRKHIDLVTKEYAKFHSVSFAMEDQKPDKFKKLCSGLNDVFKQFVAVTDMHTMFANNIEDIYNLLKDDLDENILKVWQSFKEQARFILGEMSDEITGPRVILHGDCWGNNFMFKHNPENEEPSKVAILDWQIGRYSSPALDLSYFLFAGISEEDMEDLDDILENYYNNLKTYTARLGSNLNALYPKDLFLSDWKKYSRFGILMASLVLKACVTDKDDVIDIAHAAENGGGFSTAFEYEVKDKSAFRKRAKHIVKYAVENKLIC